MTIDQDKRRDRWRRNKKAARDRKTTSESKPSAAFMRRVMKARDRRTQVSSNVHWLWRPSGYFEAASWEKAIGFAADVWLAKTVLSKQIGHDSVSPTRISRWLTDHGRDWGYSANSLRKMVYAALERIELLQTNGEPWSPHKPYWRPFKL